MRTFVNIVIGAACLAVGAKGIAYGEVWVAYIFGILGAANLAAVLFCCLGGPDHPHGPAP